MLAGKLTGTGSLTGTLSGTGSLIGTLSGGGVGHGIPAGGEPGQGLIKVSDADYDVKWMSILPEDTASGAVASFPDGSDDLPMGVVVDIDPVQDLHGYDNPWPGGGGKNLVRPTGTTETINGVTFTMNDDGTVTVNGTASAITVYYVATGLALKSGNYIANGCPNGGGTTTFGLRVGNVLVDVYTANDSAFTVSSDTTTNVTIIVRSGYTANNLVFKPMIRDASISDNTFSPYSNVCPISGWDSATIYHSGTDTSNPTEYEIPFSTDVYGGTLNVETGELVVDRAMVELDGSSDEMWNKYTTGLGGFFLSGFSDHAVESYGNGLCDYFKTSKSISTFGVIYGINSHYIFFMGVFDLTGDTVADWRAWLSENHVHVVYKLNTPITLTLTAVEMRSLFGDNNVFADTGDVSVTYKADIQKYIDKKISAAVAAMS